MRGLIKIENKEAIKLLWQSPQKILQKWRM